MGLINNSEKGIGIHIPCRSCNELDNFSKEKFLHICTSCWSKFKQWVEGFKVVRFLNNQPIGITFNNGYFRSSFECLYDELQINGTYACCLSYKINSKNENDQKIYSLHKKLENISSEEYVNDQVIVVFNKKGNEKDSVIRSFYDFAHYLLMNLDDEGEIC